MMKKYIKLLVIFILILFPNVVLASNNPSDNIHIVAVEGMLINGAEISVEGYAFISHQDNYGGSGGNIKNFFVVYTGSPQNEKTWQEEYINISNDKESIECKNSNNCYIPKNIQVIERDLWWARCTNEGCSKQKEITEYRKNNGFINSSTCNDNNYRVGKNSAFKYGSECIYYNIGFKVNLKLDVIISSFLGDTNGSVDKFEERKSYDETIKFRVVTINTDILKDRSKGEVGIVDSSLNVHKSVCEYVNSAGTKVSCGDGEQENISGLYTFKTGKMPNQVIMDANNAVPRMNCDRVGKTSNDHCYRINKEFASVSYSDSKSQLVYNVVDELGFILKKELSKSVTVDGETVTGSYVDSLYKLKGYESDDSGDCKAEHVCPQYEGITTWRGYWSLANWLKVNSEFSINKLKLNVETIECTDINNNNVEINLNKNMECDGNPEANVTFNSCNKLKSVKAVIYYKDNVYDSCNDIQYVKGNYIPIEIQADILVEQEGKFYFSNFHQNGTKISAGKGFSIFERTKGISYDNSVRFIVANKYTSGPLMNTPYISYNGVRKRFNSNTNSCETDTSFNLSQKIIDNYLETSTGSVFYYENEDGGFSSSSSLNVMLKGIEKKFISDWASNYNKNADYFDESLSDKFKSCDSNLASISCNNNVNGIWSSEYDDKNGKVYIRVDADNNLFKNDEKISPYDGKVYRGFGLEYKSSHTYKLPYAYISLGNVFGYNYGDIVYSKSEFVNPESNNLKYLGNKYFVSLKYVYDNPRGYDFPFNLSESNVSFVEGMTWNLTGTCGVEVKDSYYIPNSNNSKCTIENCNASLSYIFRPISLSNPFPKNVAVNWESWLENNKEATRIKDTKDYGVKYSIRLSKFDIDDAVMLSNINSYSSKHGSYDELNGYEVDGSGAFINKSNNISFSIKQGTTSYCGLGYFSSNCDQYANIMG